MKKTICGLLALIMTIGASAVYRAEVVEVSAAVGEAAFRYHDENIINPTSLLDLIPNPNPVRNEVVFSFPAGQTQKLEYGYEYGTAVQFASVAFNRPSGAVQGVTAEFKLYDMGAEREFTLIQDGANYQVGGMRFYTGGAYNRISSASIPATLDFTSMFGASSTWVNEKKAGSIICNLLPGGTGVSFQVGNDSVSGFSSIETVKIFLDKSDRIHISTDCAKQSRNIYEFMLTTGSAPTATENTFQISTGYDLEKDVTVKPLADGGENLDFTATGTPQPGTNPSVEISFNLPRRWDWTNKTFVPISEFENLLNPAPGDPKWRAPVGFILYLSESASEAPFIRVGDVTKSSSVIQSSPGSGYQVNIDPVTGDGKGIVEMSQLLSGAPLTAGTIFPGSYFTLSTRLLGGETAYYSVKADRSTFDDCDIYTYPEYRITSNEYGGYQLEILTPFKKHPYLPTGTNQFGVYYVYESWDPAPDKGEQTSTLLVGNLVNDSLETLHMPIPSRADIGKSYFYHIEFSPAGVSAEPLKSQTAQIVQSKDLSIFQRPRELKVESSVTVRVLDETLIQNFNGIQDFVRVVLSFNAGNAEVIHNLAKKMDSESKTPEVFYDFFESKTQKDAKAVSFMVINVPLTQAGGIYRIDADNISLVSPDSGDIQLFDANVVDIDSNSIVMMDVLIPVASALRPAETSLDPRDNMGNSLFQYANLYYLSMRGYIQGEKPSDVSNEDSLTISAPVADAVPAPHGFAVSDIDTDSFKLTFALSRTDIFKYMDNMLNPRLMTLSKQGVSYNTSAETSVKFDFVFCQDFETLKEYIDAFSSNKVIPAYIEVFSAEYVSDPDPDADWGNEIPFGKIVDASGTSALDALRAKNVCLIKGIPENAISIVPPGDFSPENSERPALGLADYKYEVPVTGLDGNAAYYVTAYTQLAPYETQWRSASEIGAPMLVDGSGTFPVPAGNESESHPIIGSVTPADTAGEYIYKGLKTISSLVGAVSATTKPNPDEPKQDEFEPPAPTGLKVANENTGAGLTWEKIQPQTLPSGLKEEQIEYEILRVTSNVMPDNFLATKDALSKIMSLITGTEIVAWRTQVQDLTEPDTNTAVTNPGYFYTNALHTLEDLTLRPGTMYVYYVRTILKNSQGDISKYSVWVPVSITTSPIKGPVNLKSISKSGSDVYTEAFVSFDAPVDIDKIKSGEYTLYYSIKPDDGDWGSETPFVLSNLYGGDPNDPLSEPLGYFNYQYKLTGLEAGSSYMLRVIIEDTVQKDKSPWSNAASIRTEIDPDKPEDESGKWQDYFKAKLEELLKRPYWPINNDNDEAFEAVYRGSMINGVISGAVDGFIFSGNASAGRQTYYIPAQAFAKMANSGKGFRITSGNVTLFVPQGAIDSQTQAVIDVVSRLNESKIKDYYVCLSVSLDRTSETINGSGALTDRINLSARTIGFKELEAIWDTDTAAELKILINDETVLSSYNTKIANALNNGSTNDAMVLLIDNLVNEFDRSFASKTRVRFNDEKQYEYEAGVFSSPVRLTAVPGQQAGQASTSISGFRLQNGEWQPVQTVPYGAGRAIMPINPGTFIFSGQTVYIPGLSDMQSGDAVTNVVVKYGLDDFFGKGNLFNTASPITNDALIGAVARMAGAGTTQDAAAFLRGKGVTVSTRNSYSAATNENIIYMLMSLYEIKTNTKVSSIRITNHNITKDIQGIGANYAQHYKAAYQIGILDKKYMPKEQMPVKDLLQILGKLSGKIKL